MLHTPVTMSLPMDPNLNTNVYEALKGNVIRYLPTTGVPVIDMMLMTWVIMSLNGVVSFLRQALDWLKQYLKDRFSKSLPSAPKEIPKTVELQFCFSSKKDNSNQMKAILFRVFKLMKNKRGVIFEQTSIHLGYNNKKLYLLKTEDQFVQVDEERDVRFRCRSKQSKENEISVYTDDTTIHLRSDKLSLKELNNWVSEAVTMHVEKQKSHDKKRQYYIKAGGESGGRNYSSTCRLFTTNRSFQNVFFPQKKQFLERFHYFRNCKETYYDRLGLPYQLGILLHGVPGCGKTSFIKALAKETGFDLISIDLNMMSDYDIERMFSRDDISGYASNRKRRIYIIEDIDCYTITHRRTNVSQDVEDEVSMNSSKGVTLGCLLNIIDGAIEYPKILVMTTNHIEKLDPALIRPGRIDMRIELGPSPQDVLKEMLQWFYPDFDLDDVDLTALDRKHTPAHIVSVFKQYPKNPHLALDDLFQ